MNQTSLNLIAISVFILTLSSLLGPLFNLSPAVPAIAAFSLLGLASIDNFGFQSKGSTLLIGLLANASPHHRDRVLRHEAGHFLVAYLLEIPISDYTLNPWEAFQQGNPGLGGVSFADEELTLQLQQGVLKAQLLERYCTVWMAGAVAETLTYGKAEGGTDDRQKFRLVWTQQLGRSLAECETKERWASLQARNLIEQHRSAYEALVEAMARRASVSECYHLIQQHCCGHYS